MERYAKITVLCRKLTLIYLLNVTDWFCTVILLRTQRFYEANPVARQFIGDIRSGCLIKCVIPAAIVIGIIFSARYLNAKELRLADDLLSFCLVFYLAVNLDHIINFGIIL